MPFVRVSDDKTGFVLDPGGLPGPAPITPRIYEYDYTWSPGGGFSATLERTVSFAGLPVIFTEDVEITSTGVAVVSDSIVGSLWVVLIDGTIVPGIFPASFAPQDAIPELAPCGFPGTTIGGVPFRTELSLKPVVDFWTQMAGKDSAKGAVARVITEEVAKVPEVLGPLTD